MLGSQIPNLKVGGSIPHAITSANFGISALCITYSVIKGKLLLYHAYLVWEVKNVFGW